MFDFIHMTVAYSNALLAAVLPHFSDYAAKLDLPVPQPIPLTAIRQVSMLPTKQPIVAVLLTNGFIFGWTYQGYVDNVVAPHDWFHEERPDINWAKYAGRDHMTVKEALALARKTLVKLGYPPEAIHSTEQPKTEGPDDTCGVHIPYCQFVWEWPPEGVENRDFSAVRMSVNLETKKVLSIHVAMQNTKRLKLEPLNIGIVPELEQDYRLRVGIDHLPPPASSNAMLVAVLPRISDFAAKLNLAPQPIPMSAVKTSLPTRQKNFPLEVTLTNGCCLALDARGLVAVFYNTNNFWRDDDRLGHWRRYTGRDHMTTNQAITMARQTLARLGYGPELTHADESPYITGPFDHEGMHFPYCNVSWLWPKDHSEQMPGYIEVQINLDTKALAGLILSFARDAKLDAAPLPPNPELEQEYRLYAGTNAVKLGPLKIPVKPQPAQN
jgi:hypothetical protein